MTKEALFIFTSIFLSLSVYSQEKRFYNGNFELNGKPNTGNWYFSTSKSQALAYPAYMDSVIKVRGKYSVRIEKTDAPFEFGIAGYKMSETFSCKKITIKGYIKTTDVKNGYAGLWLRIDSAGKMVQIDNMNGRGISGSNEWSEYSVSLSYNPSNSTSISFGAILTGSGKIWIDDIRVYLDEALLEPTPILPPVKVVADIDTLEGNLSKMDTIKLNRRLIKYLSWVCQTWGFLKYHSVEAANGEYNADKELIGILKQVLEVKQEVEVKEILEKLVSLHDKHPSSNLSIDSLSLKTKSSYGCLFTSIFSPRFRQHLSNIKAHELLKSHYYVNFKKTGNPEFKNERLYTEKFPDIGIRLISLFRYWNIIQYYYPYRYLVDDWEQKLEEYIPKVIKCSNQKEYTLTMLELVSCLNDTHANIWNNDILEDIKGNYTTPFQARFIENKLIVTNFYLENIEDKYDIKKGDILLRINGRNINHMVRKFADITPASNHSGKLRDLPGGYLLRTYKKTFKIVFKRNHKRVSIIVNGVLRKGINQDLDRDPNPGKKPFYILRDSVLYLNGFKFQNKDMASIKELLKASKGLIIDMRTYPLEPMLLLFGNYIKSNYSSFAELTCSEINTPGHFFVKKVLFNGMEGDNFKRSIVVLVNEQTQSQAEFTVMAFQSSQNVTVLGSQTAGADGNISSILLPGAITTAISGLGVYYPDGSETQQCGLKINTKLEPTIRGIQRDKDELLDAAVKLISVKPAIN